MKMKILVFGATGGTGRQVVVQALTRGWSVRVVVRSPEKMQGTEHENLEVIAGEITKMSTDEVCAAMKDCDAVLSALGSNSMGFMSAVTIYSDTIKTIVHAMKESSVKRLVCVTSWYTKAGDDHPFFIRWVVRPFILGSVLDDMARMENYMEDNATELNYTVVKPPHLLDKPIEDRPTLQEEGQFVKNVKGGLPRANVARFMLDIIPDASTYKKMYAIALE